MITQIIRKQCFYVTHVRVIGKCIPRQFLCVIGALTESLMEMPELHERIPV